MKDAEDEAFDELAKRQGAWGGGFPAKRAMAADKLQEPERETLKLALKALELVNIEFVCNGAHHAKKDRHSFDEECPVTMRYQEAITAIKAALAQPAQEPVLAPAPGYCKNCKDYTIEEPLYAQPAQEPVACVMGTYGGMFVVAPLNSAVVLPVGMALYARPA